MSDIFKIIKYRTAAHSNEKYDMKYSKLLCSLIPSSMEPHGPLSSALIKLIWPAVTLYGNITHGLSALTLHSNNICDKYDIFQLLLAQIIMNSYSESINVNYLLQKNQRGTIFMKLSFVTENFTEVTYACYMSVF